MSIAAYTKPVPWQWPLTNGTNTFVMTADGVGGSDWLAAAGGGTFVIRDMEASDLLNSTQTGWSNTTLAPLIVDPTLNMVAVRAFDGTADEAVGFKIHIPSGLTSIEVAITWRKSSSVAGTVIWDLYARDFDAGAVITAGAWDTNQTISTNDPGSNQNLVTTSTNFTLASLGLTADELAFFQINRDASADTYNADAYLMSVRVSTV